MVSDTITRFSGEEERKNIIIIATLFDAHVAMPVTDILLACLAHEDARQDIEVSVHDHDLGEQQPLINARSSEYFALKSLCTYFDM